MTTQQTKDLEIIVKTLSKVKSKGKLVGFTVELRDGTFDVSCGWNYPNSIASKVLNLRDKITTPLDCSAEVSGGTVEKTSYINGGQNGRQWMRTTSNTTRIIRRF